MHIHTCAHTYIHSTYAATYIHMLIHMNTHARLACMLACAYIIMHNMHSYEHMLCTCTDIFFWTTDMRCIYTAPQKTGTPPWLAMVRIRHLTSARSKSCVSYTALFSNTFFELGGICNCILGSDLFIVWFYLFIYLETESLCSPGTHYITRLALNSQKSCLRLPSAGIKGTHHPHPALYAHL